MKKDHVHRSVQASTIASILSLLVGCTPTVPPNVEVRDIPATEAPQPLKLALQPPDTIENSVIAEYLNQLPASSAAQGVWMQSEAQLLANHQGKTPLPAASLTKIATSLAALKKLGPDYRFTTQFLASGPIEDGVLQGDLIVQGSADPFFVWEDAIATANLLAQKGITKVAGNLVIVGSFYMNFKNNPTQSGILLKQGVNSKQWPAEAETQYQTLNNVPRPELEIQGTVKIQEAPTTADRLLTHRSKPLVELLKLMNRYSNNAMAEMLAQRVGGAQQVATLAAQASGVPQTEVQLINGSGLGGDNRISARAACGMMLAIANLLHPQRTIADVLAVTGQDVGILNERPLPPNAVIKSGTLNSVSALAGALPTQNEDIVWFTIINGGGPTEQFRAQQETLLQQLMTQWGTADQISPLIKMSQSTATVPN